MPVFNVTDIQFFDHSDENSNGFKFAYSANVIINGEFVIQLSGNEEEAHKAEFAPSDSAWVDGKEDLQENAEENININDVIEAIENDGFENNFNYLSESSSPF
tara:strand:+ start:199 stop:507 length:309 start_codon:yes stop_codon:yes gene_type:complete